MSGRKFEDCSRVFPEFPENRYDALEEVQKMLGFNSMEWKIFFKVLRKADDGFLEIHLGDLQIQFALWSEDEKRVHLSLEYQKERTGKSATYEYSINELEAFSSGRKLRLPSVGEI